MIAGDWSGTLREPQLPGTPDQLSQSYSPHFCIDGAWKDTANQWTGALSGVATSTAFSGHGLGRANKAQDGTLCTAVATIEGPMAEKSLEWTVGAFSPTPLCPGVLPSLVW